MNHRAAIANVFCVGRHRPLDLARWGYKEGVQDMAAGIRSQQIATTRVVLPPTALAGLMGAALLIGGLLGVATKSEFGSIAANLDTTQPAGSSAASLLAAERDARIEVGRGTLVTDAGTAGRRPAAASHAADHVGVTERLFPVTSVHPVEHGPLP